MLLFLAVFFWSPFPLPAQPFFRGFTTLRVLQTQYFELLYPRESEETARRVSLFADRTYEEVSARLGIDVGRRIPVTIVPHIDEFNSFMNAMPYPHILLLDTPPDNEWTTFTDSLEKLFLHEMTHAVSLSTRGGALNVLHRIFGGWVYPPALNVPLFMTEGIAVSFESLDGYGRARDPLIKQKLRQESYENKFLNPYQVSGASDLSAAARGAWYEYGGLFSRYLQETYGMEKYAELWRALGNGFHFSFIFYNNGFYYYFKRIYGRSVVDVWNEFRNSLSLTDIESSEPMIVNRGLPPKPPAAASQITGMAAAGGRVFILDRFTRQLSVYNGERGKTELVIPVGTSAYDVAASSRGDYVLVSSYRYHNNRTEAVVTEYSGGSGRPRRTWRGLYRGSYFRDGVVGISSRGYQSRIVFRKGNPPGASPDRRAGLAPDEEVLLEGNGELVFSNPRPVNDSWIAFTVARRGRRELGFYHYDTGRAYTAVTDLPDDKERWEFLRYLQVCEGRLLFGYDHDDRMYKLALVDPAGLLSLPGSGEGEGEAGPGGAPALSVIFTERDFSGAVALPVLAGEALYYRGSFFGTDQLMRYPESLGALKGLTAELRLTPWDTAAMDTAEAEAEAGAADPAPEVPALSAAGGGQGTAAAPPLTPPGPEPLPGRVYLPFKYLNPLYLWLPIPLFRADPEAPLGFSLDGGGILSVMIDPPELNTISLQAAMDARFSMLDFNVEWSNANLGFPLVFKISDGVTIDSINYRAIRFGQELTLSRSLGAQGPQGFLGAGFNISRFYTQQAGGDHAAYSWDFYGNSYKFMARLGVSSLSVMPWETFGQGFTVQAVGWLLSVNNQSLPQDLYPRIDAFFQTAFEPMVPLRVSLYGAWDDYRGGMNLQGTSSQYPSPVFQPVAAAEYQTTDISGLSWIAGGEAELRLFSLNVQRSFSHLYINRLLGTLAYRAVLYDAAGFSNPEGNELGGDLRLTQSLVFRLGSGVSSVILTSAPYKVTLYLQAALKLSRFGGDAAGFTDVVAITPYIGIRY